MQISISNLAWDVEDDQIIKNILKEKKINTIDIVPSKYFKKFNKYELNKFISLWNFKKFSIHAMQSLLFGKENLNIFSGRKNQIKVFDHLEKILKIAKKLGIVYLVFGSPKNRDISKSIHNDNSIVAQRFFNELGNLAKKFDIKISLEPCPKIYGGNFLTNTFETAEFVKKLSHKFIRLQLDTGSLNINRENIDNVLKNYSKIIGHIHLSEPFLLPIKKNKRKHEKYSNILKKYYDNKVVCIEMLQPKTNKIDQINNSLNIIKKYYS